MRGAAELGLRATRRLITDWVELGLLDEPTRRGLGRGLGSAPGTWPFGQAELFIDLLRLRQRIDEPVTRVAGLTNLPVVGWLWHYPDVPLRQVRRALATWCGNHRRRQGTSGNDARRAARQFVGLIENPHASAASRNALGRHVEESLRTQTFDDAQFRTHVENVFDPHGEGRVVGPETVPLRVDLFVRLAQARFEALAHLDQFSDQQYEDGRLIYLQNKREYAAEQPALATQPFGHMFKAPSFEKTVQGACLDLLTILGMSRLAPTGHLALAEKARTSLPPTLISS